MSISYEYELADDPDGTRYHVAIDFPVGSCRTDLKSMIVDGADQAEAEAKARRWAAEHLRPGTEPTITPWGIWADARRR
jgi:hypothetical protein